MGINKSWGGGTSNPWVRMTNVTSMSDWAIAREHMHRFASVYAVPAYGMISRRYGVTDVRAVLDRMAFHWNTGLFTTYDPNWEYMPLYRDYVNMYRGPVEAEDGVWVPPA
jgi:hypothetical protein